MSDALIAMKHALYAAGYRPTPEKPLDPIVKELKDFVNSVEYKKLILKEWDERKRKTNL